MSAGDGTSAAVGYANKHIPQFLSFDEEYVSSNGTKHHESLQVLDDGTLLSAKNLKEGKHLNASLPILVRDSPLSIGMKLPTDDGRPYNIRKIGETIGSAYPVSVIDVRDQEELEGWTLGDLVEYFEDEERLLVMAGQQRDRSGGVRPHRSGRRQRRAAAEARTALSSNQQLRVLNQISLEISKTPLSRLIKSPQFVRDLDWIDHAWPKSRRLKGDYPTVQYYCLTSTLGCYTDFHLDFGGTSVWYHVMEGSKEFILIPPKLENLLIYEDWLCRRDQGLIFLPDLMGDHGGFKVKLQASQTLVIPTGWIHAVHTPEDSLVFGGNFLHGLDIKLQIQINSLETRTRVPGKFRFPNYLELQFYAGQMYLEKMREGDVCQREVDGLEDLLNALEQWWQLKSNPDYVTAATAVASAAGCNSVDAMLQEIREERTRILENGICKNPQIRELPRKRDEGMKTKLRLKLPDGPPPKISKGVSQSSGTEIRITVPTTAMFPAPTNQKRGKHREDLDEFLPNQKDDHDEWIPSGTAKGVGKKPISSAAPKPVNRNPSFPPPKKKTRAHSYTPSTKKSQTSSRQRLTKKLK